MSKELKNMNNQKLIINKPGKHEINLSLKKEGEKLEWLGIIDARKLGDYELNLVMSHLVQNTFGRVEVRGVAENGARIKVKGLVRIEKEAQNTDSFLSMKILLLDKRSMATAEPELEIEANRVKASHSASVGKINEEQLLYLKSRGITENEAKKAIIKGFLN
jgi:Fe-S cluster assembly protein SufB